MTRILRPATPPDSFTSEEAAKAVAAVLAKSSLEPDYVAQCFEPMDKDDEEAWVRATCEDANKRGFNFYRVTTWPNRLYDMQRRARGVLFEAWAIEPLPWDHRLPPAAWQFTYAGEVSGQG